MQDVEKKIAVPSVPSSSSKVKVGGYEIDEALYERLLSKPKRLARLVAKAVAVGGAVDLYELHKLAGYSDSSAMNHAGTRTESYQDEIRKWEAASMNNFQKIVKLTQEKQIALLEDNSNEPTIRDLAYVGDLGVKNLRLLSGDSTENVALKGEITTVQDAENYINQVLEK